MGLERSIGYRWFADPRARDRYLADDHDHLSRMFAAGLRGAYANPTMRTRAAAFVEALLVYTATPGTQSCDRHALLNVVGDPSLTR